MSGSKGTNGFIAATCSRFDKWQKNGGVAVVANAAFFEFLDSLGDDMDLPHYEYGEWDLIHNVQHALQHESTGFMLECMTSLGIDLSAEIDFLEWILSSQAEPLRIREMPISVFESLVDDYLSFSGKGTREKKQLVKSFKQTDSYFFTSLLERLLPDSNKKRTRNLRQVISRYYDEKIPYKCVFLPLAAQTDEYMKLINDYWRDLHHISANHLDIYYSETDYGKSGSEIQYSLRSLPQNIKTAFPCIVLWAGEMKDAKSIDIGGLSNEEIVFVVTAIVNAIKANEPFDRIVKEANKMAQDIREKDKPITSNTVNIHGDNHGVAVAKNTGSISNISTVNCTPSKFSNEIEEAVGRIRQIEELTTQQKSLLEDIMTEAKEAFAANSEEGEAKIKSRFRDAMCFLGNASVKVLSALSSLANLAKFFGI
ncbi:MAG: hypothetical protein FWH14_00490 [Oscillospiraceae bacterium]|nr:hypothetical protein [Oscillospiraceae bacterium]